ncbi:MAG: hypothetical protein GQ565_02750 [Candidatus Aegiribacteria sp.]|nr:hypothetical protein [Candidatus Aegiribacteria sp.]
MKYVSLLLHMYQPPTQDMALVAKIDAECYTPLAGLLAGSGARVAVNINYSLTEQLKELGSESLGHLASAANLEFTDSGAYHPIFPLISEDDVRRQLKINSDGNRRILGKNYDPSGVFPPEMAYSPLLPSIFGSMGYTWTVTDDIPFAWTGRNVPFNTIPEVGGVAVLLRSNFWSNRISFHGEDGSGTAEEMIAGLNSWTGSEDAYILIAMDAETYGHHRKGTIEKFLAPFLEAFQKRKDVVMVTPANLLEKFPSVRGDVPPGSWSTTSDDLDAGKPWPLWDDPDNRIHVHMRMLIRDVSDVARLCKSDRVASLADKMLYSCPFWWASEGRFDAVQVRRGLLIILETAQAVYTETGDRSMMDRIMTYACSIPVITGEDASNA